MGTAYIATNAPDVESYDTTTYALLHTTAVTDSIVSLALSPDLLTLYSVSGSLGIVQSYTASTLTVIHSVSLGVSGSVFETIITSADGTRLYVTDRFAGVVWVLNASTLATITTISVASSPFGLAVTPTDSLLYVTQETASQVAIFNIPAYTPAAGSPIAVGTDPTNLSMSIDGLTLYCANFVVPSISVISTVSQTVTHTVSLSGGSLVLDLQITPDDSILYAVDGFAAVAWKITNPSTAPVATSFATGSSAQHLAPTTDSSQIWFTEFAGSANQVENYTVPADTLIHTIAFGGSAPGPIVITPRSGFHPTPPVTLVIPSLFIPRKGLPKYEGNDYMIDFLTIERWAQGIH